MSDFRVLFLYPNLMLQTGFPLAISIFSALLKQEGYGVEVFDTTFYKTEDISSDEARVENLQVKPFNQSEKFKNMRSKDEMLSDLARRVEEYKPGLIAISMLEDLFPLGVEMLRAVERFNLPVVAGGVFPTFAPDEVMKEKAVTMVCVGEGEETLVELCAKMSRGEDYSNVPNLWVRKGGAIIKNRLRMRRDINKNPVPDFTVFSKDRFFKPMKGRFYKMAPVETHRGCPYTCSFCNSDAQRVLYKNETSQNFFRIKDVGKIRDEIKQLIEEHGVEYIYFPADTLLAMSRNYMKEFARMYASEFGLPFFCQTRAETITEESVKYLKEMNCHSMSIGIEHGNEDYRVNVLKRSVTNKTIIDAFNLLEKTDIMVTVNNIMGFPDETRELAFDTIGLNRQFNAYSQNAYFFTPYHGTPLRELCIRRGYISGGEQTMNITKGSVLHMPQFPYEEIKGLIRTFTLYVKFPKERWPEIKIAERSDEEGDAAFRSLQQEFWQKYLK